MVRRFVSRLFVFSAFFALILALAAAEAQETGRRGRKYKPPPPTSRIEVTVLRDTSGKPIENAAVIFHPMEGERDAGNMEMKSNEEGKAVIDVLALNSVVRLQVIAKGFQTFGQDYKIDKANVAIEVRMKRPAGNYSIYTNRSDSAPSVPVPSNEKPAGKPSQPSQAQPN